MGKTFSRIFAGTSLLGVGVASVLTGSTIAPATALAQQGGERYPCSEIRWIVPFAPGGGVDIVARIIADRLTAELGGVPIVIDNRGGASGSVGAQLAKAAAADGCTLMSTSSSHVINQAFSESAGYDLTVDFDPVIHVISQPYVIAANAETGVTTLDELIELSRTEQVRYATSGTTGAQSIAGELLTSMANIEMTPVAYSGGGEQVPDMLANRIQVMFTVLGTTGAFEAAGDLNYIAVTSTEPLAIRPDIPPVADTLPGYHISTNYGVVVPAGTPPEQIDRLHEAIQTVISSEEITATLADQGRTVANHTIEEFRRIIADELDTYRATLR